MFLTLTKNELIAVVTIHAQSRASSTRDAEDEEKYDTCGAYQINISFIVTAANRFISASF